MTAAEWEIITLSLKVSGVAVLLTMPVAFALAWLLARGRFPGKIVLDALVHLPLVLPPVVTGWLLLIAFGNNGPVGRWLADWLGFTFMFSWTGAPCANAVTTESKLNPKTSPYRTVRRIRYRIRLSILICPCLPSAASLFVPASI